MRERDEIRRWFGWDYEGFDGEIEFIFFGDLAVDDASRRMSYAEIGKAVVQVEFNRPKDDAGDRDDGASEEEV